MSAPTVNEIAAGRAAPITRDGVSYTRKFKVTFDDWKLASPRLARLAIPVIIGSQHNEDPAASCEEIDPRLIQEDEGIRTYIVTCKYDDSKDEDGGGGGGGGGTEDDNEKIPGIPRLRVFTTTIRRPFEFAIANGKKPIINSAGDPFVPAPEGDETIESFEISGRIPFATYNPVALRRFYDTINDRQFLFFSKHTAKFGGYSAGTVLDGDKVKVDISLKWDVLDSWNLSLLDRGLYTAKGKVAFSEGVTGALELTKFDLAKIRKRIIDELSLPVNQPVLLDGNGGPLEKLPPHFLDYQIYHIQDHAADILAPLGFPTDLHGFGAVTFHKGD